MSANAKPVLMPRPAPAETTMPTLSSALVCVEPDCETIYPRDVVHCPQCGADGGFPLVNWIERKRAVANG